MSGPHTEQPALEHDYRACAEQRGDCIHDLDERPELEQHAPFDGTDYGSNPAAVAAMFHAPLSSAPLLEHPVTAMLRELADAIADGGPEPYAVTWHPSGRVVMQLHTAGETALKWWAGRLGATSVRVTHRWMSGEDRYSVAESFAHSTLEVWTTVKRADSPGESTSFLPVDQLDRGFDEPPPAPYEPSPELDIPDPCQPIGCDNGYHLSGCTFAARDQEESDTSTRPEGAGVD